MGDSYRPMFPPPPAKSDSYRPTSQRHSDSTSHRGPDTYRPSGRNAYRDYNVPPARDDFSFQPPPNAPRFPPASQQDIPQHPPRRRAPRGAGFRRGQYSGPVAAHDRALLRNNTLSRDEQFLGVADGALKFNDLGDSTSEDEDNGASDSAADQPGPDAKKPRNQFNQADGDSVPKWSNPDPYTALPPPDESLKKKKDVVQLIRKAKVDQEKTADGSNAVSQNVDFISLNFDDGGNDEDDGEATVSEHESPPPGKRHTGSLNDFAARPEFARAPVDAPKRPRAASPAPQKSKKRKLRANEIDGTVVEQWLPIKGQDSTPWCTIDHSRTADVGLWLHKEICDFYEYVRPHDFEAEIRKDLVDRIEKVIRKRHGSCRLMAFGSYAAGLYLPTADMDLVMVSNSYYDYGPPVFGRRTKDLHSLLQYLLHQGIAEPNGEVIPSAKVPIIKFIDHRTGLKVDMSFENMSGVTANKTFYDWSDKYPAMPKIVTLIKHFLLMRGLNEVFLGGIGGFTVTCLVTHLIASLPAVQSGNMDPSQHLGEILLEFFDLYGNKFNYDGVMLRMNPIKYEKKGRCGPDGKLTKKDRLCIVDPNNESNDISGGSSKIPLIFRLFSDAHRDLKQHMAALESQNVADRKHSSILGCIFAGDYSSFRWQRDHLRRIYENRAGNASTEDDVQVCDREVNMEAPEPRLAATPKKVDTRRLGAIRHKARLEEAAASVSRLKAKLRGGASKLEMDDTENVMKDDMEVEDGRNEVDQEVERVTRPANTFFTRQEIDRANFFRTLHPNLAYEHKGMSEALFRELSLKALFPGILHTFPALPSKFLYNRLRQEGQRRLELLAASPEPPLTQDLLDTKKPESAVLVTDAFADQQKQAYKEPVRLRRPKSSDPQQIVSKPAVPAPTKPRNLEERFAQEFNKEFPAWPTPPSSLTEGEYNALLIRARYGHVLSDLPFRMNRMQFNAWEAAGRRKAQNIERLSTQQPTPAATTIVDLTIND